MKFYLLIFWCMMLIEVLNTQVEIQYFDNLDRVFHLNKIEGIPYFGTNNALLDFDAKPNESRVYSFNGSYLEEKLYLNQINDSLDHVFLFYLWKKDGRFLVFNLTKNNQTEVNFLTILEYDSAFENLISIDLFPVEKMRSLNGYKSTIIDGKTIYYFLEFDEITNEEKAVVRVKNEGGTINWSRFLFGDEVKGSNLNEVFLVENKEILVLRSPNGIRKFLVFDKDLSFQYLGSPNSFFQGAPASIINTKILGGQQGNYTILERIFHDGVFLLVKRELKLNRDSTWISDDYKILFPEDNTYVLNKYQKEDYTIVHYSISSLDFSSDTYGFRFMYFDKNGKMERQFKVQEESPVAIGNFRFYENNSIAYGNGIWLFPGSDDPFIIKLTLTDTTTSTGDIYNVETPSILLSNLIVDSKLRFIDNEIDLNRITVYDISGRQLIGGLSADGDISFLPVGHYVLRYNGAKGVLTERFVKVE